VLPFPAHRDPPSGVRALGFRVELVQAVDALELSAVYLLVQSPERVAGRRREQPGSASAQAPAQAPGGRHISVSGPLPACSLSEVRKLALPWELGFRATFRARFSTASGWTSGSANLSTSSGRPGCIRAVIGQTASSQGSLPRSAGLRGACV
jgi:hypothetical protein